jgi:prevent-host-death family protein
VLSRNQKGAIAEAEVAAAAAQRGIPVLRPMQEHGRYDLGLELGGKILRVQCKWGALDSEAGVVKIRLQSSWCTPTGYVYSPYTADEIDLVAAYCGDLDRCYLLPRDLAVGRREIWLRLTAPRNGQRACINLAADFEFVGAVAQLEERVHGMHEVGGSSPPSSTSARAPVLTAGAHEFRNQFGYYMERAAAGHEIRVSRHGRPFVRLVSAERGLSSPPRASAPGLR